MNIKRRIERAVREASSEADLADDLIELFESASTDDLELAAETLASLLFAGGDDVEDDSGKGLQGGPQWPEYIGDDEVAPEYGAIGVEDLG